MAKRRIADRTQNRYLQENTAEHHPTRMVTDKLLQALSPDQLKRVRERQDSVVSVLRRCIGEPAYSSLGFILYQGDCLEYLHALAKHGFEVELSLTSPPYNIGKQYDGDLSVAAYVDWCRKWMTGVFDVTSSDGAFWLNLGHFQIPGRGLCVPIPYLLWDQSPFYLLQEVVWHYGAGVATRRRLSPRNEKWLFYVKDQDNYTFNLDDIRDPNVKYPNQKKNGKFRCNPLGKNPSDVWTFPKVTTGKNRSSKERTPHPAQFPLQIVERIIMACSNVGQVVLDPFAGSCSTGIAAMGLGRVFLGVEIRQDYCELAVDRLEAVKKRKKAITRQPTLF